MDSDGSQIWIFTLITVLLVFIKGFLNACEYAIIEINDSKVRERAENNKKYKKLLTIISNPSDMINAFSVNEILLNICISFITIIAFGTNVCSFFISLFDLHGGLAIFTDVLSYLALILICAVVIIVFTEVIPKRFVDKHIDTFAVKAVAPVNFMIKFVSPLENISLAASFIFSKLFGLSTSNKKDTVTEEEILMMVEAGNETGVIEQSQREMINNIFEFGDSVVSEVMTHRTDIIAVDICEKIHDVVYLAINEGFSRIPVYENNIDTIIGIICVKDLLCLVGCEHSEDFNIRDFMRETMYIPETNKCSEVFETMTFKKAQMAVIVDEYGGTAGIVTLEDLLEEIVGNIQDEYDDDEHDFEQISDNIYTLLGSADPEDILPKLGIKLPAEHNYDTMSAFIVDLLGRIPDDDEMPSVKYENVEFTVLLVEDNWISKIKAVVCDDESGENVSDEGVL